MDFPSTDLDGVLTNWWYVFIRAIKLWSYCCLYDFPWSGVYQSAELSALQNITIFPIFFTGFWSVRYYTHAHQLKFWKFKILVYLIKSDNCVQTTCTSKENRNVGLFYKYSQVDEWLRVLSLVQTRRT